MATRIRLQRHGKKGKPFFHIVVADQRAKRDGRFIEKLGVYNPNTNPATIDIDFERSLNWVQKGAQPSDTARAILSYKGVLMKDHLLRGVQKGALTVEQAEAKFDLWLKDKESSIGAKKSNLSKSKDAERKARLAAEKEVNDARAAALAAEEAAANAVEEPAQPEAEANDAAENTEAMTEASPTEAPVVEETETEAPATEESVAEVSTEEPAAEEPGTDTPAEGEEEKKEEA